MMAGAHRILDVGCGMGFPSFYLASCGFEVVGVDASAGQLLACEVYRRQKGASYSLKYQVIEETKLPFDDNSFDGATFGSSLECMVEPEMMLREVIRVLKSGSPVAFDTDAPISVPDSHPLSEKWWIRVDEDASYLGYNSNVSAPYLEKYGLQLFDRHYDLFLIEKGKLTGHLRRQTPVSLESEEIELSFEQVLSETVEGEYTEAKYYDAYAFRYLLEKMGFTDLKYWTDGGGFPSELMKAGVLKDMPDDISKVSRALVRTLEPWTEPPYGLISCQSP
jgi:ubiquinone/menaquinone biosynthesis C-methylase UbiE